jgi:hypothetical protein
MLRWSFMALVVLAAVCCAEVAVVRLPDGAVQPQAVRDTDGVVHLIYLEGDAQKSTIQYVRWDTGDRPNYERAIAVSRNDTTAVATGTIRGPHLAVDPDGRPQVVWNGPAPEGNHMRSPLLYARLNDTGDAFEPARNLLADWERTGLDGGSSIAIDRDGVVHVIWHGPGLAGPPGEDARRVWMLVSENSGDSFGKPEAIDTPRRGACGCCGLFAFAREKGGVGVLYRTAYQAMDRSARLLLPGDENQSSVLDPWQIGQCVTSTAYGLSLGDRLALAWETRRMIHLRIDAPDMESVEITVPRPAGPEQLEQHPSLAIDERGRVLITWTEGVAWNQGGDVAWQVFDADGAQVLEQTELSKGLPVWGRPAAVVRPDGGFAVLY